MPNAKHRTPAVPVKVREGIEILLEQTVQDFIAGLAAKAQVAAIEGAEDTQFADYTLASILRDMRALAKIGGVQS
jgi:hypothetical protein